MNDEKTPDNPEETPIRDATGKFLKGVKHGPRKPKPAPETPDRTDKGLFATGNKVGLTKTKTDRAHLLYPGRTGDGRLTGFYADPRSKLPEKVMLLKLAIAESVSREELQAAMRHLYNLAMPTGGGSIKEQIAALQLLMDRLVGKPTAFVDVQREETTTVRHDFSNLPTEKLEQLQQILSESKEYIIEQDEDDD